MGPTSSGDPILLCKRDEMMNLHARKAGNFHPDIIALFPHPFLDLSTSPTVWTQSQLSTEEKITHFHVCSVLELQSVFIYISCFPAVLRGDQNGYSVSIFVDEVAERLELRLVIGFEGHTPQRYIWGSTSRSLSS